MEHKTPASSEDHSFPDDPYWSIRCDFLDLFSPGWHNGRTPLCHHFLNRAFRTFLRLFFYAQQEPLVLTTDRPADSDQGQQTGMQAIHNFIKLQQNQSPRGQYARA
jgi:hypothetical protein